MNRFMKYKELLLLFGLIAESIWRVAEFFIPAVVLYLPSKIAIGAQTVLIASLIASLSPQTLYDLGQRGVTIQKIGIFLIVILFISPFSVSTKAIVSICVLYGLVAVFYEHTSASLPEILSAVSQVMTICVLSSIAVIFSVRLSPFPELFLSIFGIYLIYRAITNQKKEIAQESYDFLEILSTSAYRLTKSGIGCGIAILGLTCVILSLYTARPRLFILLSIFLPNSPALLYGNALLAISGIVGIIFIILIISYWVKYLHRIPYSVDYVQEGHSTSLNRSPPTVPKGTILAPVLGYMITRIPHQGTVSNLKNTNLMVDLLYISLILFLLWYSLLMFDLWADILPGRTLSHFLPQDSSIYKKDITRFYMSYLLFSTAIVLYQSLNAITLLYLLVVGVIPIFTSEKTKLRSRVVYLSILASVLLWIVPVELSGINGRLYLMGYVTLLVCSLRATHDYSQEVVSLLKKHQNWTNG